jgi:hypothetical protein
MLPALPPARGYVQNHVIMVVAHLSGQNPMIIAQLGADGRF